MKKLNVGSIKDLKKAEMQKTNGGTDYAALAVSISNGINSLNWRQNTPPQN
jgi:hypothetical protein